VVRSDVVDRFVEFNGVTSVFENFGPNVRQPKAARRTFEQAYPEFVLKVSDTTADG